MDLQLCMELSFLPRRYIYSFLNSVLMHISPKMQGIGTKSIHIMMNLLHGNKFSPQEDFFINPFSSDVISPNQLCNFTCMYIGTGSGQSTCSGTMKLNRFCSWEV